MASVVSMDRLSNETDDVKFVVYRFHNDQNDSSHCESSKAGGDADLRAYFLSFGPGDQMLPY